MSTPFDPNDPGRVGPQWPGPPQQGGAPPPQGQQGYQQQPDPYQPLPGPFPQHSPYGSAPPITHAEARAQAKGAKAQAKALRPWWKKKRTYFFAFLVLVAALGLNGLRSGSSDLSGSPADPAGRAEATQAPKKAPATTKAPKTKVADAASIGTAVTAGDWEFTVTDVKCGAKRVGSQYLGKKAQGQFCKVSLKVKNNGTESGTLLSSNQKLLDKDGRQFSADDEAAIYAGDDASAILEDINPGNTLKGLLIFDIPKGSKPVQASLAGGLMGMKVATVDLT